MECTGEGSGRSDWKTTQHSTFLIENLDGAISGLNGQLFHECAWDPHVHGSGSDPETSLIPNTKQLSRPTQKSPLQLEALDVATGLKETPLKEELEKREVCNQRIVGLWRTPGCLLLEREPVIAHVHRQPYSPQNGSIWT